MADCCLRVATNLFDFVPEHSDFFSVYPGTMNRSDLQRRSASLVRKGVFARESVSRNPTPRSGAVPAITDFSVAVPNCIRKVAAILLNPFVKSPYYTSERTIISDDVPASGLTSLISVFKPILEEILFSDSIEKL